MKPTRREFIKSGVVVAGAGATAAMPAALRAEEPVRRPARPYVPEPAPDAARGLDLSPAKWIWLGGWRTLPNTVLQFRQTVTLASVPATAPGWIVADSRYRLFVNGRRVQFGPAPCDPRWAEADPVELAPYLRAGENVIGVEVLYYGFGDGTWPLGKPGFLCRLDVGGRQVCSDETWRVAVAQAWRPGQYKRWYLRSFQESFDARLYPYGWTEAGYDDSGWHRAKPIIAASASLPVISSGSVDYLNDSGGTVPGAQLRRRSIPLLVETEVPVKGLAESFAIKWRRPAEEFFDFDLPEADFIDHAPAADVRAAGEGAWAFALPAGEARALTFEFAEQHVGLPYFTIEAPAGTIVELLVHEAHKVNGTHRLLNTHFNSWTRFVCREGRNCFETFDYESLRWLQLHVRGAAGEVRVSGVGLRWRRQPFPAQPRCETGEPRLDRVLGACANTIVNQSQETIVDGMARERQQYSGDGGHVLQPVMCGFGGYAMAARFCNTFSQGMTKGGFFLDCWPAYDRLARLIEREIGVTYWGPLLDHGVGFNFDCLHYYLHGGDREQLAEVFPRLRRFRDYLADQVRGDGMVPVENLGVPMVWVDHLAYKQQRHKQCAFNLYIAGMLDAAFAPLAEAFGRDDEARAARAESRKLVAAVVRRYWSEREQAFVNNLPWVAEEGEMRFCDRSIATALLFDQAPGGASARMVKMLAERPASLGMSYPTNAVWRYWALAKHDRVDVLLAEFRREWHDMPSVVANNTMGEFWELNPDDGSQWSHVSVAPLICWYTSIMGVTPTAPACRSVELRPQLGDLAQLRSQFETPRGPIVYDLRREGGRVSGSIRIPVDTTARLRAGGQTRALSEGEHQVSWTAT